MSLPPGRRLRAAGDDAVERPRPQRADREARQGSRKALEARRSGLTAAHTTPLCNGMDGFDAGSQAFGRQGDDRHRTASAVPRGACGRSAAGALPQTYLSPLALPALARCCRRAGRASGVISILARQPAGEPYRERHGGSAAGDLRCRSVRVEERGTAAGIRVGLNDPDRFMLYEG